MSERRGRGLTGKRNRSESEFGQSSAKKRSFNSIFIGFVSKDTTAADVRKEVEKYGDVTDVDDRGLHYSGKSRRCSRKFRVKFRKSEDARHFLNGFRVHNIFGRLKIVIQVWDYGYKPTRAVEENGKSSEVQNDDELPPLPSLNSKDWILEETKQMHTSELLKIRDNIKDFGRLLRKHQSRGSAAEFFEEYELMASKNNSKIVMYETKITLKTDLFQAKYDWFTVYSKFVGLASEASNKNKSAAKALAEDRLFEIIKKADSDDLCCKIFEISENDYAQALRLSNGMKSKRCNIRISKNTESDSRIVTTIQSSRSSHDSGNGFCKVNDRDENDNIPNTPPQDCFIVSDSEEDTLSKLKISDKNTEKPLTTNTEPDNLPILPPDSTLSDQICSYPIRPAVRTSPITPIVKNGPNQTPDLEPLVSDHTELSMKNVVKRQVIAKLNEYANEINQLNQSLITAKTDVAKSDRKQIKLTEEVNKKTRENNILNSIVAVKDKEIKELLDGMYKLEKEKSKEKSDFVEKERALRKKLSRDYGDKLRRYGINESQEQIIQIGDGIVKNEAVHRQGLKCEADSDDESS